MPRWLQLGILPGLFACALIALAVSTARAPLVVAPAVTAAPHVPPPIERRRPGRVTVALETSEVERELADGVRYRFWTFNGTVPGPFLRVRVGDVVEVRFTNSPTSRNAHSINLHAVTGPGGGGWATQVLPGGEAMFEWKAMNPGLYVYHCMTPSVPVHMANGMYGMVLVEPEGGLPSVDHEYYVVQSEFYTRGGYLQPGLQDFDAGKARAYRPEYVVFNGRVGALVNEGALTARVGETVRLFLGNAGPSYVSSFHVVGEIFDRVYPEGGLGREPNRHVQTTMIPLGGSAIVEFTVDVPGRYLLVDHAYFRSLERGAVGHLDVSGPAAPGVFNAPQGTAAGAH